ncbi:MAG: FecR domain-containing protein, partial [Anaerohalosphaera sp.]|nr:FecR domain-containing protein [Anaerohalosphaera sp.]
RVISRSLMYLAVISSAALLFIMLLPLIVPPAPPIVANLTKTVGAQWDSAENSFQAGDSLREGDLVLRKGTVQLYFLKGAEVIVRAPARLRLEGIGQLFMYSGNISVKVEKDCDGFLVRTAGATMVDYGTEFGVIAFEDGRTQVHVFDGVVGLRTGSDPLRFGQATRLKKGQASGVNSSGQLSGKITKAVPRLFARQIPEPQEFAIPGERIDLADIVGGGNGFGTGFLKGGIDAGTGEFIEKYQKYLVQLGRSPTKLGEYRYNQVSELPYVDGVFVPNDKAAPLEVTSQGHKLLYCPVANSVYYSKGIVNRVGGVTLNGKEYGSREHPVIAMLRNKGITFDLAAIRADIPGSRIARFNALAGISSSVLQFSEERGMRASFMVLVDGEVRFVRSAVTPRTGGIPIDLELEDTDRFLTLITAYEQVGMRNTSVFAEAALGLE